MARCIRCGRKFDVSTARRSLSRRYGAGTYNDYCPDADTCEDCVNEYVSADWATGAEIIELMGPGWDWD